MSHCGRPRQGRLCVTLGRGLPNARHEDFAHQYARAREEQADRLFEECLAIADDTTDDVVMVADGKGGQVERVNHENIQRSRLRVDTRKWMAGKLAPKKYGDRIITEQQQLDADGKPVKPTFTVNIAPYPAEPPPAPEAAPRVEVLYGGVAGGPSSHGRRGARHVLSWSGRRHFEGRLTPRFRTIQVCPKDLPSALRQAERAVNRPNGPVRKASGRMVPNARHKTA